MNNEQRKHFDPIGSAILDALSDFVGEIDPGFKVYKKLCEEAPAGAMAVICRAQGGQVTTMPLPNAKLELGSYLFLGAPVIAKTDQANAAVQAMQNLGYTWHEKNKGWMGYGDTRSGADNPRLVAGLRTLVELGYTYKGGDTWEQRDEVKASNLFPGQQASQAAPGVVAAAQGMSTSLEEDTATAHFSEVMGKLWAEDEKWTLLATALGLHPDDRTPAAIIAARVYMTCVLVNGD